MSAEGRLNTLGLQPNELNRLMEAIDQGGTDARGRSPAKKRDYARWSFRQLAVPIAVVQPGATATIVKVAARNISSGGMSFLHNAFVYQNSPVRAMLDHLRHGPTVVNGTVTRCRHIKGVIHEVGIKFDKALSVRDYLPCDPFSETFSLEKVSETQLHGIVVHVDPSVSDRDWLAAALRGTGVKVRAATDSEAGLELAREGCDAVIVPLDAADLRAEDVLAAMQMEGGQQAMIVVVPHRSDAARDRLKRMGSEVLALCKPLKREPLMRALGEVLIIRPGDPVLHSDAKAGDQRSSHMESFMTTARQIGRQLAQAMSRGEVDACRTLCQQLVTHAPAAGYDALASLATEAAAALPERLDGEIPIPLRRLSSACERLRMDLAA